MRGFLKNGYPIIMRFFKMLGMEYGKKIKIRKKSLISLIFGCGLCDKNSRRQTKKCTYGILTQLVIPHFDTFFGLSPRVFVAKPKSKYQGNQRFFADFNFFAIFHSEHFEKSHYNGVPILKKASHFSKMQFFDIFSSQHVLKQYLATV